MMIITMIMMMIMMIMMMMMMMSVFFIRPLRRVGFIYGKLKETILSR